MPPAKTGGALSFLGYRADIVLDYAARIVSAEHQIVHERAVVEGVVLDSGVRDGNTIKEMGFPIFCKGHSVTGTIKNELGTVNHPISIGVQIVRPGDIILGDDDGVVVIPIEIAEVTLKRALKRQADEEIIREKFRNGLDAWTMGNYSEYCKNKGYDIDI